MIIPDNRTCFYSLCAGNASKIPSWFQWNVVCW